MPTKLSRQVLAEIEKLGFDYVWSNGKGYPCYVHPDDPQQTEVSINLSINNESGAQARIRDCRKIARQLPRIEKRHGESVKERQAVERERAKQRVIWAEEKQSRLASSQINADERRRLEQLVQLRREQLLRLHFEMTETVQGNRHAGRGSISHVGGGETPL